MHDSAVRKSPEAISPGNGATLYVPIWLRRVIPRRLKRAIKSAWLRYELWASVRSLMNRAEANEILLRRIRRAWGNEDWSGDISYLEAICREAGTTRRPILECGSGLTTLLLAIFAARRGVKVVSLEHIPEWKLRVNRVLARFALPNCVFLVPLRNFGDFDWYELPSNLPAEFGLVVCDGPPGATRGGRYGLMPLCRDRFALDCIVFLDDTEREGERTILHRWKQDFEVSVETSASSSRAFARCMVKGQR